MVHRNTGSTARVCRYAAQAALALPSLVWAQAALAQVQEGGGIAAPAEGAAPAQEGGQAAPEQSAHQGAMGSLPGSPKPLGLGLSPEAPAVPATAGGRAPSFGAPTDQEEWALRLGGRISAFQTVGIGRRPRPAMEGYEGTPWHVPAVIEGRSPFWAGAGLTLYASYGNSVVSGNVSYYVNMNGLGWRGFQSAQSGPNMGQAYLAVTPHPMGDLQLQIKVGAITENYGGVGQWGWGIFGPLIATRGYGETVTGEYKLSDDARLWIAHGFTGVPAVPENNPRGAYTGWIEPAISSFAEHQHAGITYKNNYGVRVHHVWGHGTDERRVMATNNEPRDGDMHALIADARARFEPYGHFGLASAYYDFSNGYSVNDGIWWGVDWTQGGRELVNKFVGLLSEGNGSFAALSAQWDFSISRILWHPRSFGGQAPDIRGSLAAIHHWTVDSEDPYYRDGADGYVVGVDTEYVMLPWFGVTLRSYLEGRDQLLYAWNDGATALDPRLARWRVFSVSPGLVFRSDWTSQDSIQLAYSRRFYNDVADDNPARPLDRHVVTLGAVISF